MDPTPADRVPSNTIMRSQVRARATFLKPGRCHPLLALFAMAAFLLSLAARRARAEDPKQVVEIPKEQIETPAPEQPATVPEQQVMSLPTGENKSGVTSKAISVPKGPGTIDVNRNQVVHNYLHEGGAAYLSDIYDTSAAVGDR